MATDRGAVLTLRAALRGVVDFSKARVLDVSWWRRTNALVLAMAEDDELQVVRARFDLQRSLVGNSGLTEESFKACQEAARSLLDAYTAAARPWEAKTADSRRAETVTGLVAAYKRLVGDPDDPAFRDKLRQDAATLAAREAAPPAETDDQRIDRLIAEREARRRQPA